jgi:hypothetical protein
MASGNQYDNGIGRAVHLMQFYMSSIAESAGWKWSADNDAEVQDMVECIVNAAQPQPVKVEQPKAQPVFWQDANQQIAAAIAALYRSTNRDNGEWTDTDELIQQAAFGLWNQASCDSETMAVYLMQLSDMTPDTIASFCDIDVSRVYAALRDHYAQQEAR